MSLPLGASDVAQAREILDGAVHRTLVARSGLLDNEVGAKLFLKCENFQKTGSFKVRGVLNYLMGASEESLRGGVVTVSAGNHAQALAWAARRRGLEATVAMPRSAPATKVAACTETYGARVHLAEDGAAAFSLAHSLAEYQGLHFVHPFDDARVMAGQGTAAAEFLDDVEDLDALVVPVGGGGLIGGVLAAVSERRPTLRVYGVEPESAAAMTQSVEAGKAITLPRVGPTSADGLAAPMAGRLCHAMVERYAEDMVTVSERGIARALNLLMTRAKLVVEPAAAAALAAVLEGSIPVPASGRIGLLLSGGNADPEVLGALCAQAAERGDS